MSPEGKIYASAVAFRQALEERLTTISRDTHVALERLRKHVAFDRFLARLFAGQSQHSPMWLLKGGYSMEIRYSNIARMTKDVDLTIPSMKSPKPEMLHEMLVRATEKDMGDWFTFLVGPHSVEMEQAVYGGWRYPVSAMLAGRKFTTFHVDVAVGDAVVSAPDWEKGPELLAFAGIAPANAALLPREQQFAEKVHSFTYPRPEVERSRVKDFVDMVLLIEHGLPDKALVLKAIAATFDRRKTHPIPTELPPPPPAWERTYSDMAADCGVKKKDIKNAFNFVSGYWKNLL